MATTKIVLTSSWQLVAADGIDFILQNPTNGRAAVTFAASAPAADAPYHTVECGEGLVRMGVAGAVYVKDIPNGYDDKWIIISTGV